MASFAISPSSMATVAAPPVATQPSSIAFRPPIETIGLTTKATKERRSRMVVSAFGDVSSEGTTYLVAGAIAVALLGTAFPIIFSRKDMCPECDGAGFVRRSTGGALRANAARKDQTQIVCARCNGLGKLGQIDK